MTSKGIITVISRSLNMLNYRIVDHGQRVAYIMYKMLQVENNYSESDLHKVWVLCLFHDIGAYKTEDMDTLADFAEGMKFEIKGTLNHCVYGYLFLKNFSILSDFADAVLYHHTRYDEIFNSECRNKDLAAKLFLADRIDILSRSGRFKIDETLFSDYRNTIYSGGDIDLIIRLEQEYDLLGMLSSEKYLLELEQLYANIKFTEGEMFSFLKMLSYLIDFRSEYTVLHNIAVVRFGVEIAKLMGLSEPEIKKIYYGSLLHDVGKIATTVMILEKSEKLDDFEYEIIKDHVVVSELILKGCVEDDILQIAIRHHEKLDGSGYPKGLTEKDLTLSEKIVCIADILSALYGKRSYKEPFSSQKILFILLDMAEKNKISKEIVNVVVANYMEIVRNVEENCFEIIDRYKQMHAQYEELILKQ